VQICGDAHVQNLGAYESAEGHLIFDVNDFDETTRAPFEWDLLRFATSLVLAGLEAGDSRRCCAESVAAYVRSYREGLASFSRLPFIDLLRVDVKRIVSAKPVDQILRKAERATPAVLLKKLTQGSPRPSFRDAPPLLRRLAGTEAQRVLASLPEYERSLADDRRFAFSHYRPVDAAFKVVGTGSVGVNDYAVLFAGMAENDVLFLQIKEESPSCYAPYVPQDATHNGRRVVEGQRRLQRTSDPFLGWTSIEEGQYLVRQLNDHKAAIEEQELKGRSLRIYAEVVGTVFARGHARTGEAAALAAYCGTGDNLDRAITRFALAYADQTVRDHKRFVREI
jgi:uncharacterized protein (DUF2252 family)